jgi:hypothetical protein
MKIRNCPTEQEKVTSGNKYVHGRSQYYDGTEASAFLPHTHSSTLSALSSVKIYMCLQFHLPIESFETK